MSAAWSTPHRTLLAIRTHWRSKWLPPGSISSVTLYLHWSSWYCGVLILCVFASLFNLSARASKVRQQNVRPSQSTADNTLEPRRRGEEISRFSSCLPCPFVISRWAIVRDVVKSEAPRSRPMADLQWWRCQRKNKYCSVLVRPCVPLSIQLVCHFKCWAAEVSYSCQWKLSDVSTWTLDSILWCWFVRDVIDVTRVSNAVDPI